MKRTNDIWFVAWLSLKGIDFKSHEVKPRTTLLSFNFEMEDEKWSQLRAEFMRSPHAELKTRMAQIKDLAY